MGNAAAVCILRFQYCREITKSLIKLSMDMYEHQFQYAQNAWKWFGLPFLSMIIYRKSFDGGKRVKSNVMETKEQLSLDYQMFDLHVFWIET